MDLGWSLSPNYPDGYNVPDGKQRTISKNDRRFSHSRAWHTPPSGRCEAGVTAAPGGAGSGGALLTPFGAEAFER
jgi:hypothetical protein